MRKLGNLKVTSIQSSNVNKIIKSLDTFQNSPDMQKENDILYKEDDSDFESAPDFSADVFIEDDKEIIAIELKSVRPNSGEMRGENKNIKRKMCIIS